ncbi:MAG: hypothetical protein GKR93_06835 [Gammaproteobacteria bacterium]|nr:hypothetical protein [Gammaproteobacteria bacterium]
MEKIQLRLVITGLLLILLGFLYGMIHTIAVDHAPRLQLREDYKVAFTQAADKGFDNRTSKSTMNNIESVNARTIEYQRAIGAHTHAIYLGLMITILGLVLNFALANSPYKFHIMGALGAGAAIYPLGLALQASGMILAGEVMALLGSVAVIGCIGLIVLKLLTNNDAEQ